MKMAGSSWSTLLLSKICYQICYQWSTPPAPPP